MSSATSDVGVRELRRGLTSYLRRAAAGESIIVTSRDKVIAQLGPPPAPASPPRRRGALKGMIRMADDFDAWPKDVIDSFEADL